jgi:hypothetical protein
MVCAIYEEFFNSLLDIKYPKWDIRIKGDISRSVRKEKELFW